MDQREMKQRRISGTLLVLEMVRRGDPVTNIEILRESYKRRGKGLVVNSRISDARELAEREGWTIKCRPLNVEDGVYEYRRTELAPIVTAETWREVMEGAAA